MSPSNFSTVVSALAALGIVGLIVWSVSSCSTRENELAQACIKAGGTVISLPNGYHCIAKNVGGQS